MPNTYSYTYDNAGNRLTSTVNGATTTRTYNAANRVNGWTYDNAGNLTNDGTTATSYDPLNRVITRSGTSFAYNGDSTLVSQVVSAVTTRYTQDLAAPLSQILSDGTNTSVYGMDRLYSTTGTRTWYTADALDSVRALSSDAAVVSAAAQYDPYGQLQSGTPGSFGFTGELQQGSNVYLRARWYHAANGGFTARDPFEGMSETPYSLHSYAYGYSNPVGNTDPSGRNPGDQPQPKDLPCVPFDFAHPDDPATCQYPPPVVPPPPAPPSPTQAPGVPCPVPARPKPPEDIGYIEGAGYATTAVRSIVGGVETVFDLYDFEMASFYYTTEYAFGTEVSVTAGAYVGTVSGWSKYKGKDRGVKQYAGQSTWAGGSVSLPFLKVVSLTGQTFASADRRLQGTVVGVSAGVDLPINPLPGSAVYGVTHYTMIGSPQPFRSGAQPSRNDALKFVGAIARLPGGFQAGRSWAILKVLANGYAWDNLTNTN